MQRPCAHCVTIPSARVHLLDAVDTQLGGGAVGRSEHTKYTFLVTNAQGAAVLDVQGHAREYYAEKPSMAAQKAFYSWRRAQESWVVGGPRVRVDDDVRAWIAGLPDISAQQCRSYIERMEAVHLEEVMRGFEIYIARSDQKHPRRYVCYQKLNLRPNAHQVRKLIVMESRAHPCAEGIPADSGVLSIASPF